LRLLLLSGLEEGDDLLVDLFGPLYKDQVPGILEDAKSGARDGFGERDGVSGGHVAVVGAVDHERRRGDVLDVVGSVEAGAGHRLLVVSSQGGRIGEAPA
jgi:hypothetical protein